MISCSCFGAALDLFVLLDSLTGFGDAFVMCLGEAFSGFGSS